MNETLLETIPVTIYGASDDLFELESPDRSIYAEYDCYGKCIVVLTAPNGEQVSVYGQYGQSKDPSVEWEVGLHGDNNADWKWEKSVRPDHETDPAIILHVPIGTTERCLTDEEDV